MTTPLDTPRKLHGIENSPLSQMKPSLPKQKGGVRMKQILLIIFLTGCVAAPKKTTMIAKMPKIIPKRIPKALWCNQKGEPLNTSICKQAQQATGRVNFSQCTVEGHNDFAMTVTNAKPCAR